MKLNENAHGGGESGNLIINALSFNAHGGGESGDRALINAASVVVDWSGQ